jgi:hypothetical protein
MIWSGGGSPLHIVMAFWPNSHIIVSSRLQHLTQQVQIQEEVRQTAILLLYEASYSVKKIWLTFLQCIVPDLMGMKHSLLRTYHNIFFKG